MDRAFGFVALAALERAVDAVCEAELDLRDPKHLRLDLTKLEQDAETWQSTMEVLLKHLCAA